MRTKTLLLAAVLGSASVAGTLAQAVYSVNAVGYVNVSVGANSLKLIANPLQAPTNTLASVFPTVPGGTFLYKYSPAAGFTAYNFDDIDGWQVNGAPAGNVPVAPGEGVFIKNLDVNPFTVTFVGDVLQGTQTITLPAGLSLVGSKIPQSGGISSVLGFPTNAAAVGTFVYVYNAAGAYDTYNYDDVDGWVQNGVPNEPQIAVAQGFWVKNTSGAPYDWSRTFSVNN